MAAKKIPLLKSAFFWNKIADVFGLFGTGGLITLSETGADKKWSLVVGITTGAVQFIRLFFADNNRNNIPDILEDQEEVSQQEITVAVKENSQGGPPIVDVSQTTVTKPIEP
jgi:hypothetical protein